MAKQPKSADVVVDDKAPSPSPKPQKKLPVRAAKPQKKQVEPVEMTADRWARGRRDPITVAFVAEHKRQRTVKRTPAQWMALYRDFLKAPRG